MIIPVAPSWLEFMPPGILYVLCLWPWHLFNKLVWCCKTCSCPSNKQIPMGTNHIEWYHLTYLTCICEAYFYVLCPCLLCLCTLLFYGQPSKSLVDRQGYLPISLPSCFTAADFVMALNSLDDSAVPKKIHRCIFFFCHPNEREARA